MNAANLAFHAPNVNIAPIVSDFIGCDATKLTKLGYVAEKVSRAAYAGPAYASMLTAEEFAVLRSFIAFAESDFALAGVVKRDDVVDQPHSPDESHFLDREKV